MAKILYAGDAFVQTGFGRVAEYLLPALAKEHEVHVLATNWHGDHDDEAVKYKSYPAMAHGSDPFGSHRIAELIQTIEPDLVWVTNDLWVAINLWDAVKQLREKLPFKFFVYTPIDSYGIFPELNGPVSEWDGLATYTEFGKEELIKMGYDKPIHIIPHGTDFTKFFPIDPLKCRRELGVPEDTFIVFNGNRNQPRKRIDLSIKGFIEFAKDKPDARLWLNMGAKDMGWEIIPLFKRVARDAGYDAAGKLILTSPHFSTHNCLSIEQLNKVYNAVDIGINTCIGEGWGLVNSEHAATGTVQVVPDHTSLKEIFNDIPRIACNGSETDRNYGLERLLPDPSSVAAILNDYYEDRSGLQKAGQWCHDRIHEKQFTWPVITKKMLRIVDEVLSKQDQESFKGFGAPVKIG